MARESEPERMNEAGRRPGTGKAMSGRPKSLKRSVVIGGHKSSISWRMSFGFRWEEVAAYEGVSVSTLLAGIDTDREDDSLSSAVREIRRTNQHRLEQRALDRMSKRS